MQGAAIWCGKPPARTPGSRIDRIRRSWKAVRMMEATFMNYVESDLDEGVSLIVWARSRRAARRPRGLRFRLRFA
jgi:hypothetical protein